MNFHNPKTKRIITSIIAGILVLTMILPLFLAAL